MWRLWERLIEAREQSAEINLLRQEEQPTSQETRSAMQPQNQQCLESLWLLSPLCQAPFKALVAGGLLEVSIRDSGSGHSLSNNSVCYSASARHCAHYVVTDCVHAVTFAGGFGPNTREPSQNHEPTWLRRPLGKDKSCLLFQNFPKPNHFLKATKIHQFFQESTPLMASKEISDHQMTPSMGFLSTLNLRSHSHTSATHLSWNPCVVWVHNALGNGTRSNTGRFHWWEYAPCRTHEILPYMQGRQVNVKS